ncbi:MAG: Nudix family hydrolase [Gammaproteobacteria bacterium]|nr:Nudix family hydrolase [Gammaproteobacteria bacterium]
MLKVVVGVLFNQHDEVLISRRHQDAHLGGMWEFPGGKYELGESALQALQRELNEEIGISIMKAEPLIQVQHQYPERHVLLDVWMIRQYRNQPFGRENQALQWVRPDRLNDYQLPPADMPIIKAIQLPRYLVILDADHLSPELLSKQIKHNQENHQCMFWLRAKTLGLGQYQALADTLLTVSRSCGSRLLLNSGVEHVQESGADGLHLSASQAASLGKRRLPPNKVLGVSCHNAQELEQAQMLDADYAVLSPVNHTRSHPQAKPLGWQVFSSLVQNCNLPVYALGGLDHVDMQSTCQHGAQGLAGIGCFQISELV